MRTKPAMWAITNDGFAMQVLMLIELFGSKELESKFCAEHLREAGTNASLALLKDPLDVEWASKLAEQAEALQFRTESPSVLDELMEKIGPVPEIPDVEFTQEQVDALLEPE